MRLKVCNKSSEAFSRVELITVLASTALLGALGLSVLGSSAVRSDSAVCGNNLRQIGRAFHMWASDHGGENSWWTHYSDGGSFFRNGQPGPPLGIYNIPGVGALPASLRNNAWFHFLFINQELQTPARLVCPADPTRRRTQDFSNIPNRGFIAADAQNRALSYLIGVHAQSKFPATMLSGDRSLREDSQEGSCPANVGVLSWINLDGSPPGWTSELHPNGGNLLLNDGRVEEMSGAGLANYMGGVDGENGSTHFAKPF